MCRLVAHRAVTVLAIFKQPINFALCSLGWRRSLLLAV
jgi:hypothetical protein